MIEAIARKDHSGFANATMPAMTKIAPRKPWSHFQPPWTAPMERNSSMPAAIAMTPKRMETAYTVVELHAEDDEAHDQPGRPGDEEDPPGLGQHPRGARGVVGRFAHGPSLLDVAWILRRFANRDAELLLGPQRRAA